MNKQLPPTIMIKNCDFLKIWSLINYAINKYGIIVPSSPNYTNNPNYNPPLIKEVIATIVHDETSIQQILNKIIHPMYLHHDGIDQYINQFVVGSEEYEHGRTFHYSYGLRLQEYPGFCSNYNERLCDGYIEDYVCEDYNSGRFTDGVCYINQLKFISEHLDAFNKRLQAVTWVTELDLNASIVDEMKKSVPCLQRIRIENYYDKYYTIVLSYRSRDAFKAFVWNDIGLIVMIDNLIKQKRKELNLSELKLVQVVEFIDSLHAYEADWNALSKVPIDCKTIENCLFI